MTRKSLITFVSVVLTASLPLSTAAQAGKKTALGIVAGAVVLGAMANAAQKNQAKAKARARAKAKARARAKAKARAAAKRKAAQKRAIAAKRKKAAAQKRALAAKKKKAAAEQKKVAAAEAKAREEAAAQAKADAEKTEGSFVSAPSTAALLTSKDVNEDANDRKSPTDPTEVAVVDEGDNSETTTDAAPIVENTTDGDGNCKRFIPAVGLTVSVGC